MFILVFGVFKTETGGSASYTEMWCGRRDLNPSNQLGKLMSYRARLQPRALCFEIVYLTYLT